MKMNLGELLLKLNGLKLIPRTGWLFCNVSPNDVEDVAQHSFEVAAITLLLADELKREGQKIDSGRAVSMAVVHDWAEAEVADFPYTALKHLDSPDVKKRMESRALKVILEGARGKENCLKLWEEYSAKRTIEARVVHAADYLSMLVQAIKYRQRGIGSKELNELWAAVKKDLTPYAKEFKTVRDIETELESAFLT